MCMIYPFRMVNSFLLHGPLPVMVGETYVDPNTLEEKTREWLASIDRKRVWREPGIHAALLVLDMQDFFLSPGHAFLPAARAILPGIVRAVNEFHGPVIFTRHIADPDPGNLMNVWWRDRISGNDSMITGELLPHAQEVISKRHYSAFRGTDLDDLLRSEDVDSVVICGVMTDLCCETTARDAFMSGFRVYFVADGTATATEERHIGSLRAVSNGFGEVISWEEWR